MKSELSAVAVTVSSALLPSASSKRIARENETGMSLANCTRHLRVVGRELIATSSSSPALERLRERPLDPDFPASTSRRSLPSAVDASDELAGSSATAASALSGTISFAARTRHTSVFCILYTLNTVRSQ